MVERKTLIIKTIIDYLNNKSVKLILKVLVYESLYTFLCISKYENVHLSTTIDATRYINI